ncbi:PREDICTED: cytochrome P450 CYP736A12-like [Ipomoea nil]|uniref:cytochrome P450 CYP736A12-like n=1 Tax=Ipomoea nil TaxID=35883 RepID=UPI000901A5C1|nr:PREDICTED: cytochrome P450 CYP736A12-like [Ipomoea nil]XP_019197900.1 PREDICTED: cytochrome P450 CYP736A12-like [Ipomoea nil]
MAVFGAIILSLLNAILKKKSSRKLPPGPRGVPLLGHLHLMMGKTPHQDLQKLAKIYGPIMHLRFGLVNIIVVSSAEAAKQFLKTHDLIFATRPPHQAAKYMSYDQKSLSFGQYGLYWRTMRKLCTLELLSNLKITSFQSMRREELRLLVQSFKQQDNNMAVDLSAEVASMVADMSCRMVFGKKYEDKEIGEKGFKAVIHEAVHLAACPNLGDYFPYLGKLDVQGLTRRMKAISKLFDQFFERIIDDHEQTAPNTQKTKDFVDTLLETMKSGDIPFQFTRQHVKSIMLDMLVTSMDTSATAIEWIMSELLRHPEVMNKVKEELERQVSFDRMVEEEDLEGLEYLEMVIKESLRMHPVVSLLLHHTATEDCVVIDGVHMPEKARVVVNLRAIGRDPSVWSNPDKFIPERFDGSNVEYRGQNFELIPFGAGRRSCPGMQLGITIVKLVVAQLVHCFDWDLPKGMLPEELDMDEVFGIVVSRAKHLMAIPTYRLCV